MKVVYGMMEVMGAPVAGMQAPTPQLMSANPMDIMPPPIMVMSFCSLYRDLFY
jgi:hypothetical protein